MGLKRFKQFIIEQDVQKVGKFRITSDIKHLSRGEWDVMLKAARIVGQKLKGKIKVVASGDIIIGYPEDYIPEQKQHKTVYGGVYVVKDDKIVIFQHYLRDVNSLVELLLHELGHRHWHKFLGAKKRAYWQEAHGSERAAREEYANQFADSMRGGFTFSGVVKS